MSAKKVTIVGGGIIGICTALSLQREGVSVTLVDKGDPGMGCTYGNAGLIQLGSCVPLATPGVIRQVPRMLLDADQPLVIRWQYLASLLPFLSRFLLAARPQRVEEISVALADFLSIAVESYETLLTEARAPHLIEPSGEIYPYQSRTRFDADWPLQQLRMRRNIDVQVLSPDELRELEPALAPDFYKAVYLPASKKAIDPYLLARTLFDCFVSKGGHFLQASVDDAIINNGKPVALHTSAGALPVEHVIVAAGAQSKKLARQFGDPVPLEAERGYHLMLPAPRVKLRHPLVSGDYKFGLVQMADGLRLAGTAELASFDAPPNYDRANLLFRLASRILPGLSDEGATRWLGCRPSMPDSLPVVGRSTRFQTVFYAFGHGHSGIALAAATARVATDLLLERKPPIDVSPFAPERFS